MGQGFTFDPTVCFGIHPRVDSTLSCWICLLEFKVPFNILYINCIMMVSLKAEETSSY